MDPERKKWCPSLQSALNGDAWKDWRSARSTKPTKAKATMTEPTKAKAMRTGPMNAKAMRTKPKHPKAMKTKSGRTAVAPARSLRKG